MYIAPLHNTRLSDSIRRGYEAEARQFRIAQQATRSNKSALFQTLAAVGGLSILVTLSR